MKSLSTYIALLVLLVLTLSPRTVFADHGDESTESTKTKIVTIEYALPFAGIMPNHPLYFFKSLRDALIEKMITNDIKKAEFYILQADKRLQMSIVLQETNNAALSETTRADAYMYREKSYDTLVSAKAKGIEVPRYVIEKLVASTKKHQEILLTLGLDVTKIKELLPKIESLLVVEVDKK